MKHKTLSRSLFVALLLGATLSAGTASAAEPAAATSPSAQGPTGKGPAEGKVQSQAQNQAGERRKEIISEAVAALAQTKRALAALDAGKTKEALSALTTAIGKLELILARDPELALAPVDVAVMSYDVYASPKAIKEAVKKAEDYLEHGEVQKARALLDGLASEIVISVINIPLETYPDAIKAVVPLIDAGKTEEAKAQLQAALDTLVVVDQILPLPILRAEALLDQAQSLAEKEKRTAEENKTLSELLKTARTQLELGQALGYGDKKAYEPLYAELKEIEGKISGGQAGHGFFDKLRKSLRELKKSL